MAPFHLETNTATLATSGFLFEMTLTVSFVAFTFSRYRQSPNFFSYVVNLLHMA